MPLEPQLARTLFRSLLRAARHLELELARCEALRPRELAQLKAAAASALPRDLRGLLDLQQAPITSPLSLLVGAASRRVWDAAHAPGLASLDGATGLAALRHLHGRIAALRPLAYAPRSDARRHGVAVQAASAFLGAERDRFFFRYRVRIDNDSPRRTVRLLGRAWTVRDLDGRAVDVAGPGVVGKFPLLEPGAAFEYSSGVPLATPVGAQSGAYEFVVVADDGADCEDGAQSELEHEHGDEEPLAVGQTFTVPVAPFGHRSPTMDGRALQARASAEKAVVKKARRKRRR